MSCAIETPLTKVSGDEVHKVGRRVPPKFLLLIRTDALAHVDICAQLQSVAVDSVASHMWVRHFDVQGNHNPRRIIGKGNVLGGGLEVTLLQCSNHDE